MARLSIRLFGSLQVTLDGEPVVGFESDKVRALLVYLAAESGQPHRREVLAGLLWPRFPERSARTNLRRALANLRQTIGDHTATPSFLNISHQTLQINSDSDAWCDVTEFTRLLETTNVAEGMVQQLERAVVLYRGDFMQGFSVSDSVAFEEWLLLKRERFRRLTLLALYRLALDYEGRGDYEGALPYAWRQVELEPWREEAHRQLMRLLALNGQRGAALAQYETCQRALVEQLGVEPAHETNRLYEQIRDGCEWVSGQDRSQVSSFAATSVKAAMQSQSERAAVGEPYAPTNGVSVASRARQNATAARMALVGLGVLLLVIVGIVLGFSASEGFGRSVSSDLSSTPPPPPAAQLEAGKIVFPCETATLPQICVTDNQTGRRGQVTENLEFERIGGLSWSPSGQQIVFAAGSASEPDRPRDHKLFIVDADGSDPRQLTYGDVHDSNPAWSPDGEWIAFQRSGELWLVHPDGSAAHVLLGGMTWLQIEEAMMWSPDSQQIAFLNAIGAPHAFPLEVRTVSRDGTDAKLIHSFEGLPYCELVGWAPNGEKIACARGFHEQDIQFLLLNADGSAQPEVVDGVAHSWSPNFWPQWGQGE